MELEDFVLSPAWQSLSHPVQVALTDVLRAEQEAVGRAVVRAESSLIPMQLPPPIYPTPHRRSA